jgi:hypothetical protein
MPRQCTPSAVATLGIDIGKNTFHLVGLDQRGAIVLQLKSSREQLSSSPADRGQQGEVYGLGSSRHRGGSTATCWQSRLPTRWLVSPGPCSPAVENISR